MARSAKKEVQVSLETVLWNCRVALRGVGSTEKNRDAVIALVFLKFAGDCPCIFLNALEKDTGDS